MGRCKYYVNLDAEDAAWTLLRGTRLPFSRVTEEMRAAESRIIFVANPVYPLREVAPGNIFHLLYDELVPLLYQISRSTAFGSRNLNAQRLLLTNSKSNIPRMDRIYEYLGVLVDHADIFRPFPGGQRRFACFENFHFGRDPASRYQYSAHKHFAPRRIVADVAGAYLHNAVQWLKGAISLPEVARDASVFSVIIFARRQSRRVLNEPELVACVRSVWASAPVRVQVIDENEESFERIVRTVSVADLIIGVHGASLIFSMMLPAGSSLLELFPFGISPAHGFDHYKALAGLPQFGLNYYLWQNEDPNPPANVIEHDVSHIADSLPPSYFAGVVGKAPIPRPSFYSTFWNYRRLQDTTVDLSSVQAILERIRDERAPI